MRYALGLAWRGLRRIAWYVVGLLLPVRLTRGERAFIRTNAEFWHRLGRDLGHRPGVVMVEPQFHPVILLSNASFAAIVAHARDLTPLFILEGRHQRRERLILASYPGARFVFLDSPRYAFAWLLALIHALLVYRRWRRPSDILEFTCDGIRFGDVIYDAVLAQGYATVHAKDLRTLRALHSFFVYRAMIRDLARRHRHEVRAYVSAHGYIGLRNGTFTRYLLQSGIEVLNRIGSHQINVRKYRSIDDIGTYALRPTAQDERVIFERHADTVVSLADRYLGERFGQRVQDDVAADLAFDRRKRMYTDTADFRQAYGLVNDAPLVFVMLHAFNDYPHSHFRRRLPFQDYYDWFVQTLALARDVRDVNWIFKEHPAADFYPTRDVDLDVTFAGVHEPHIRFLRRDADFNGASLRHIAHAIVTCIGTAGLEYSCFGVPCVLAGESPFSGYGFTIEPGDSAAYAETLRTIAGLPRLPVEQVRRAKAIAWFEMALMEEYAYPLCPHYSYDEIKNFGRLDVWGDAAALLKSADWNDVARQIRTLATYVQCDACTQLVNTEKYPFLIEGSGLLARPVH